MSKSLGQFLKELRTLNRYSQEFVASNLDIIRQTYSHYETGRIMPPTDSLYKLSQLYNVSIDQFFSLLNITQTDEIASKTTNSTRENYTCEPSTISSTRLNNIRNSVDLNTLTPSDLEMLFYYQNLDVNDKIDILEFMKIKYQRHKKKK